MVQSGHRVTHTGLTCAKKSWKWCNLPTGNCWECELTATRSLCYMCTYGITWNNIIMGHNGREAIDVEQFLGIVFGNE